MVGGLDSNKAPTVYVFERIATTWVQTAALQPSDATGGVGSFDPSNASIAISSTGKTAVIGGPLLGNSGTGAAYIFAKSGPTWAQQASLTRASPPPNADQFGASVAILRGAVAVGAVDNGLGSVYVYSHGASGWNAGVEMPRSATTKSSNYGKALAIGTTSAGTTVAAGAAGWNHIGGVYLFTS